MKKENANPAGNLNGKKRKHIYDLRNLDTSRLQAMLQQESFLSDDDNLNEGLVMHIVDILEEREPVFDNMDVNTSLEKFKTEIIPKIEKDLSIVIDSGEVYKNGRPEAPRKVYGRHRIAIVPLAVILTVIIGSTAIANVAGFDLWRYVVNWGKETFRIGTGLEVSEETEVTRPVDGEAAVDMINPGSYRTIDEAIGALDISILTPNWIPDGFSVSKVETSETPMHKGITILYQNEGKALMYNAAVYSSNASASVYEMDEGSGEVLVINDIEHYFMCNMGQIRVVWIKDECVYSINGNISKDEIVKMLNSIYEGER